MTLKEKLAEIPEDEYVYLGTKKGSSWLYIAKRKELEEKLDKISNGQERNKQKKLDSVTEQLNEMNSLIIQQNRIISTQKDIIEKALKSLFDACSRIEKITADFESARKSQKYLSEYLYDWKDMGDRDVVDSYPHKDIKPEGISLLITGDEAGKYWTLDEIKKDKKGKFVEDDDSESETE